MSKAVVELTADEVGYCMAVFGKSFLKMVKLSEKKPKVVKQPDYKMCEAIVAKLKPAIENYPDDLKDVFKSDFYMDLPDFFVVALTRAEAKYIFNRCERSVKNLSESVLPEYARRSVEDPGRYGPYLLKAKHTKECAESLQEKIRERL